MAKMELNIKTFDMEGGFDPSRFNQLISDYDGHIPQVNQSFINNQDALQVFKNVAGSPRLNNMTQGIINGLNNSIESTASYFDSVRNWTSSVADAVQSTLEVGLPTAGQSVDRTVLDQISANFQGGFVGIENFSDAATYIGKAQEVVSKLQEGLSNITDDVQGANDSLPAEVHNALGSTISTNNDAVLNGYRNFMNYLNENIETFTSQLQNAINDMAAGARGN